MPYLETPSQLSVLLLTDIVGSTDLKSRLGLTEYARRLAQHDQIFKNLIEQFPGAEILKDTGDGYFASFATTSHAVRFALQFQHAMRDQPDDALRVRVGIHVGEVAQMDKEETGKPKIVGLAADLVSRVTHLAVGGQILLTRFAFNEARQFVSAHPAAPAEHDGQLDLKWIAHGPYRFKGTDEPIEVFEVGARGIAPLIAPPDGEDARRAVALGEDDTLGWRPAVGLDVPDRPQWELEKRLGEGGFGEVWLARHKKLGTRRVFKFCFDPDRLRSFKRELALFRLLQDSLGDRPDIARIYEVQLDHPPYFLESEYTEGGNLEDWSDMEGGIARVPLQTRLDIAARVADAVAAAHSVGVLHKDIKPSNILIAIQDGQPRPRLADFGIGIVTDRSKLQGQPVTLSGFTTSTTQPTSYTGTRLYVPPEVLVGKPFTVQGDVYALGVLLYQMVVADLNKPLAEGWQRDVEDDLLREDIAQCVDGDPAHRLSSASDLAKRIRSLGHRRQWQLQSDRERLLAARRHRITRIAIGSALAMVILTAAVGAIAWREWALHRESERLRKAEADQRAIADNIGTFLMDMIKSVAPDTQQGRDVKMIDAIDVAARKLDERQWHPEVEAYLRHTLCQAYRALGEPRLAEPHARRSVELIEKIKGPDDREAYIFRGELGMILFELGQLEAAEQLIRDAAEQLARIEGPEAEITLDTKGDLALILLQMGRNDDAERIINELVENRARTRGPDDDETLQTLSTQAGLLYQRGLYVESAEVFGRVYEARRRTKGEDHPLTLLAAHNYASLLYRSGRTDEAIQIMQRVLESQKRAVGPEHPRTLDAMLNLSQMLRAANRDDEAIDLLKQSFEIRTRKFGPDHPGTLHAAGMLGGLMAGAGKASEAEPLLRQTLELHRRASEPDQRDVLNCISALALSLENQMKLDQALPMHREALELSTRLHGQDHPNNIHHRWLLGRCLVKMNQLAEAEQILLEGLRLSRNRAAPDPRTEHAIVNQLVMLYEAWNKPAKASEYRAQLPATQPTSLLEFD